MRIGHSGTIGAIVLLGIVGICGPVLAVDGEGESDARRRFARGQEGERQEDPAPRAEEASPARGEGRPESSVPSREPSSVEPPPIRRLGPSDFLPALRGGPQSDPVTVAPDTPTDRLDHVTFGFLRRRGNDQGVFEIGKWVSITGHEQGGRWFWEEFRVRQTPGGTTPIGGDREVTDETTGWTGTVDFYTGFDLWNLVYLPPSEETEYRDVDRAFVVPGNTPPRNWQFAAKPMTADPDFRSKWDPTRAEEEEPEPEPEPEFPPPVEGETENPPEEAPGAEGEQEGGTEGEEESPEETDRERLEREREERRRREERQRRGF